jgi:hypothetical protein
MVFGPRTPVFDTAKAVYASDHAPTVIGNNIIIKIIIIIYYYYYYYYYPECLAAGKGWADTIPGQPRATQLKQRGKNSAR